MPPEADEAAALIVIRVLNALRVTARCESFDELEDLERRSVRRRELEATLAVSERSIVAAGASGLERLVEESAGLDIDELEAQIPFAERKVAEVESERSRLSEEIGRAEAALRLMDGSGDAAAAAERAQAALATVRRAGEQYVTTRLAALLLRRAIERYREDNEGPLIERANELFPLLTVRSFEGIGTRYDEKGQLILIGRRGREEVPVEGMSDGTRDQLYLALRIAALEQHFRANGPMPVVADDLLINFDDRRAAAALRVLAELSRSTQVMVFTHHRHLIELARATLEAELFRVHELQPLAPVRLAAA